MGTPHIRHSCLNLQIGELASTLVPSPADGSLLGLAMKPAPGQHQTSWLQVQWGPQSQPLVITEKVKRSYSQSFWLATHGVAHGKDGGYSATATTRSWWPVCAQGRGRKGSCTCCIAWCLFRPSANATCTQCILTLNLITSQMTCPVTIRLRGDSKGAFFLDPNGKMVTKSWFVQQIRSVLSSVGAPQHQYAGHSFRIRAATTAAMAGVEDSVIQALGRWPSAAFLQYIRTPKEHLARISLTMAAASKNQIQ